MVMHATNTIAAIIFEIHHAIHSISLQRVSTVPLEKRFGVTIMHAGRLAPSDGRGLESDGN
jgi:hypothetical protein